MNSEVKFINFEYLPIIFWYLTQVDIDTDADADRAVNFSEKSLTTDNNESSRQ